MTGRDLFRHRSLRAVALLLVLGLVASACGSAAEYVPAGIVRTPAPDVSGIVLPDITNGVDMAFIAAPGEVLIVYWGYTACPDVCPTTLAEVRKALREIGDKAESVDVAMITVDPDRDTVDVLPVYVQAFVADGVAVRTDDAEVLAAAAEPFGVQYSVTIQDDGWVDVVHTGFLYAVDDQGLIRLTWPFGIESEDIAADLRVLLDEESLNG
jgi:protein SCO1/2